MPHERNPDFDALTKRGEERRRPNPKEDLSVHGRRDEEEQMFGPDGNGESPEMDDEHSLGRGAD